MNKWFFVVLLCLIATVSCLKEYLSGTKITVDPQTITLKTGETAFITAALNPSTADVKSIVWTSTDTGIAVVSGGKVTAKKPGSATIIASAIGGAVATCDVVVKENVAGIIVDKELELYEFEERLLKAQALTPEGTVIQQSLVWESQEDSLLHVFGGMIFAKMAPADGHPVIVSVRTSDNKYEAECSVTIKCHVSEVRHISGEPLDGRTFLLQPGEKDSIGAAVYPLRATDKRIQYTSSNPAVATVDEYGTITAIAGSDTEAIVTAVALDEYPEHSAKCTVIVNKPTEHIYITHNGNKVERALYFKKNTIGTFGVLTDPADATGRGFVWESSDPDILKIDGEGNFSAENCGTVSVRVVSADCKWSECKVTVYVPIESLTVTAPKQELFEGEQECLSYCVSPEDAEVKSFKWTSLDTEVANVAGQDGIVTALNCNEDKTARISLTVCDVEGTAFTKECSIKMKCRPSSIAVSPRILVLAPGETGQLSASISPSGTSESSYSWSSGDPAKVGVDANGFVTAHSLTPSDKPVVITAATKYRDRLGNPLTDRCEVYVFNRVSDISIARYDDKAGTEIRELTVNIRDTIRLKAVLGPDCVSFTEVNWKSGNENIVKISQDGLVEGVNGGETDIIASSKDGGKIAVCKVTVKVPVGSVKLWDAANGSIMQSSSTVEMNVGEIKEFAVLFSPGEATDKAVSWNSQNNKAVCVVEGNTKADKTYCTVIASEAGDNKIRIDAKPSGSNSTLSFYVKVKRSFTPVEKISINGPSQISIGQSVDFTYSVLPQTATIPTLSWNSTPFGIVDVDDNGRVTGLSAGTVTITASAKDGSGKVASTTLTVVNPQPVPVEALYISPSGPVNMKVGETITLKAYSDSRHQTVASNVEWSPESGSAVTVTSDGKVTAVSEGTATVTVKKLDNKEIKASCQINVSKDSGVESVTLLPETLSLYKGERSAVKATFTPSGVTPGSLFWNSSDTGIVTVDNSGNIEAVGVGTAHIILTADGVVSNNCTVTVKKRPAVYIDSSGGKLSSDGLVLNVGETYQFKTIIDPVEETPNVTLEWSVSYSGTKKVEVYDGKVIGISPGTEAFVFVSIKGISASRVGLPVIVREVQPESLSLDQSALTMKVGDKIKLSPVFHPANTSDRTVNWSSSDTSKAIIDLSDGSITAKAPGKAVITVTSRKNYRLSAKCYITVVDGNNKVNTGENVGFQDWN